MGILTWILFGLIAGGIAKLLMPGKDPGGCFITMFLGIAGAIVGGWIGTILGFGTAKEFNIKGMLVAIGGACLLLFIYRILKKRK